MGKIATTLSLPHLCKPLLPPWASSELILIAQLPGASRRLLVSHRWGMTFQFKQKMLFGGEGKFQFGFEVSRSAMDVRCGAWGDSLSPSEEAGEGTPAQQVRTHAPCWLVMGTDAQRVCAGLGAVSCCLEGRAGSELRVTP